MKSDGNGARLNGDRTACRACPLSGLPGLLTPDETQRAWIEAFKTGETSFVRGEQILRQGARASRLYTVMSGVLMRFRLLEDGRRQIINFMFPGDLIGLQSAFDAEISHSALGVIGRNAMYLDVLGNNRDLGVVAIARMAVNDYVTVNVSPEGAGTTTISAGSATVPQFSATWIGV